jgi:large subunit ribosomal protein L4
VRNIEGVEVLSLEEVQVWHVLKYQWTVLESSVVQALEPEESGEDAEGSEEFSDEAEVEQEEEQRI